MRGAKIAKTDEETGKVEHEQENTTEKFEIKEKEKEIMEKEKEEDKKHHIHTEAGVYKVPYPPTHTAINTKLPYIHIKPFSSHTILYTFPNQVKSINKI